MCYENNQKAFIYIQCTAEAKMFCITDRCETVILVREYTINKTKQKQKNSFLTKSSFCK